MAAARIAEPIDILEYSPFGLTACVPPIALATHPLPGSGLLANHERGDLEAVLFQALLIRVGTILGGFNRSSLRLVCCLYFISRRLPMPLRVFSIRAFCEVGC